MLLLSSLLLSTLSAGASLSALSSQRHLAWTIDLSDDEDDDESESEDGMGTPTAAAGVDSTLKGMSGIESTTKATVAAGDGGAMNVVKAGAFEKAITDILVTGWDKKEPVEALLMEVIE